MAKMISKEVKAMFANAETIGELRMAYLEAFMKYQTPKLLEKVNAMYIDKFDAVKELRRSRKGKIYRKPTEETVSFFLNAVNSLKGIEGLEFYKDGEWIWVKGETKKNKDALKSAGAWFSGQRKEWRFM